jgi:hypothetical protein
MADFRLDEATRGALIGLMPFSQGGTIRFTPDICKVLPENIRPSFTHRALTRAEFNSVRDIYADENKGVDKQKALWEIARKTVTAWENIFDLATGEPIPYKQDSDGGLDKGLWESLPLVIRREIFTSVTIVSGLTEPEKAGLR